MDITRNVGISVIPMFCFQFVTDHFPRRVMKAKLCCCIYQSVWTVTSVPLFALYPALHCSMYCTYVEVFLFLLCIYSKCRISRILFKDNKL